MKTSSNFKSKEELLATIHKERPDLVPNPGKSTPIPPEPPLKMGEDDSEKFDFLLPENYDPMIDPTEWYSLVSFSLLFM